MKGLTKEIAADETAIEVLTARVAAYESRIKAIGSLRDETHDELVAFLVGIRKDIADLEAEITREFGRVRSRINVRQNRIEKGLNNHLAALRKQKRRMQQKLKTGPARYRASAETEIKRLMEPVVKAQQRVDAKAATVPGKVTPEALIGAQQVLKETHGALSAELAEEYRIAVEIVENAELDPVTMKPRTGKNRLTAEQMAVVEAARAKVAELRPRMGARPTTTPYDEAQAALDKLTKAAEAAAAAEKAPVPVQQAAPPPPPPAAVVPEPPPAVVPEPPPAAVVPEPAAVVPEPEMLVRPAFVRGQNFSKQKRMMRSALSDIAETKDLTDEALEEWVQTNWRQLSPEKIDTLSDLGWQPPRYRKPTAAAVPEAAVVPEAAPPPAAVAEPPAAVVPESSVAAPEIYSKQWWAATKQVVTDMLPAGSPTRATIDALDDMQLRNLIDASWDKWP